MYGLNEIHISKIQSVFESYEVIDKAVLYGSRAKGNYRKGSDIDICLFGCDLDLTILQKIEKDNNDLLLPYKTDISIYYRIENYELIEHIDRVGMVFYTKKN